MLDVRVNKDTIIVRECHRIPIKWKDIKGEDGETYAVKVPGTGKPKYKELCRFNKPTETLNLPDNIKERFSDKEQTLIQDKIAADNVVRMKKAIQTITEYLKEYSSGLSIINKDWEGITPFLTAIDKIKKEARNAKWKKV